MTMQLTCAECDQPLPRKAYTEALQVVEVLDLRGDLASLDPSARRLGFCDRGVELASSIHASAHSGEVAPRLRRKAKRWLREAYERLDMWQVAGPARVSRNCPQPAEQRLSA
jgi:hypothetical protein